MENKKELGQKVQEFVMHHVQDSADYWPIGGYKIPLPGWITLHGVMAILATLILSYLFIYKYKKGVHAPKGLTNMLETMVLFVRDEISIAYLGKEDGRKLAPLFLSFFFFILTLNLMGLVPVFASATGNLSVTLALASVTFGFLTIGGMLKNGPIGYFKAFVPHGVPVPVLLIIVPLEIMGIAIKGGVLALRLFANLLAGHIVLFTLLGLIVTYGMGASLAIGLGLFVFFLEILVAFLQAYIFTMLSAMFIGQIYHPEH